MTAPTAARSPEPTDSTKSRRPRWPWLLIVATTLVALLGAATYLSLRSSSYEANANVLVAPLASEDPNFQGLPVIRESSDGARPVQTGAGLLSGPNVARLTAKNLGAAWSPEAVEADVVVEPRGESNIVAIIATTDSATGAARLANAYTKAALGLRGRALAPYLVREISVLEGEPKSAEQIKQLRAAQRGGDPTLSVASDAQIPNGSADPSSKLVLLVAFVVGVLVGLGAIMVVNVARASSPIVG